MSKTGDAIGRFELALSYLDGADKSVILATEWLTKAFAVADTSEEYDIFKKRFAEVKGKDPRFDAVFQDRIGKVEQIRSLLQLAEEADKSDKAKAFELYMQAAELGCAEAENTVGHRYDQGVGVEMDKAKAGAWFKKAADQGLARAQCSLGVMYENGEGVEKDEEEAVKWYRKAADQGLARAQYFLGWNYHEGIGVEEDDEKSKYWLEKAADQGHKDAKEKLDEWF